MWRNATIVTGLESVVLGVAANGLYGIAGHLCRKSLKCITGDESTLLQRVHQKSVDIITEVGLDESLDSDEIIAFLGSPEVDEIVRQIYSMKLLGDTDQWSYQGTLISIREEYLKLWSIFLGIEDGHTDDSANALFDSLIKVCDLVLEAGIEEGMLSAHEARSNLRYNLLSDTLASIRKNIDILKASNKPDVEEFLEFEKKYRAQVGSRHENITAPDFDAFRKRPIDSVYVNPIFTPIYPKKDEEPEELSIPEFLSASYRSVILGNPGSGKSTLAIKLCHDLATRYAEKLFAGRQVTPILVILRDYGTEKKATRCSILKFIEMAASSNYQISPPNGAFEYMLLNGRSVIIFDGLDELLETNYRLEISNDIETFCTLYPSVPVLVTSREVGYEQAPLDPTRFEVFRLASFNDDQVKEYVTKWFAADTDLTPDEQKKKSEGFLNESRFVPDLRENPLILALLCNIYRGENYIPKNRPDVYEKCANMLFSRWDKGRNLYIPLPIEALIRPAMTYLAYHIYTDEKLRGGVSEKVLIRIASKYLHKRRFEDSDEAEMAAKDFVEFCRGRAWVFTEVGSAEDGEGLYHFTHRTFLEYFAASHLSRIYITPRDLIGFLHPRIAKREWDVVAQLAFQIQYKNFDDAGDELLLSLLDKARESADDEKWNILSFAAQCLEFIIPSPGVTRSISIACIDLCIAFGVNEMKTPQMRSRESGSLYMERDLRHRDRDPNDILGYLLNATTENRTIIANSI
ncbi:NACHT domain-containing protein [Candidatus Methanocrinis natronophilus]|uniref:NACHT domain-containing protein n=1 Tax=Candidatus Methanocrinis natronophilus TaxID=3033396 RepID=A0ABT5X7I2_9EURY|nr:NACHT domain-containing protein [Candidatus Methanocrinis natronophilus]MDF0590654.1 NACHT domain-containing protein [Candidatus Methanocrinis natronophilus]